MVRLFHKAGCGGDMKPSDIDRFWKDTVNELKEIALDPVLEINLALSGREFTTYNVSLQSYQNKRLRGWYSTPNDIRPGKNAPAILAVPGYQGNKNIPIDLVMSGYVVLTLFPRAQGESIQEWDLEEGTKLTYHIEDKYSYYYRGAYMDCIRGLDFLQSKDEVDHNRLGMWSRSQGGGFTLATAALDDRLNVAVAEEPFLCNFPQAVKLSSTPYCELRDYLAEHENDRDNLLNTLSYFDSLNLVSNITCPTLVNIGMKDEICPYDTIMPVFNEIPGIKALHVYPDLIHSPCTDFNKHAIDWINRYL